MSAQRSVAQLCRVQLRRLTSATRRTPSQLSRPRATVVALAAMCVLAFVALPAAALALPDGRGYEQVTPLDKNGIDTGAGIPSINGNAVNWEAIGGCCGATSSAVTHFPC